MKLSHQIKPISYLKAHAAEVARNLGKHGGPLVITQNGEAKLVVQDIKSYEQTVETLALLKILALGSRQIEQGKTQQAAGVIKHLRKNRHPKKLFWRIWNQLKDWFYGRWTPERFIKDPLIFLLLTFSLIQRN